ncbi:MAG: hypothetical protein ABIR59_02100 [Gemmatimonadales bacterium]
MRTIIPLAILVLTACSDVSPPTAPPTVEPAFSGAATRVEGTFFGVASCQADIGYNIRFGGPRVLVRHVSGTDTTLSFGTQDFIGWRLPETTFDQTTVDFTVLGGAEMFNVKREPDGTLQVRIHEGTLIFRSVTGNYTVIARHVIRIVPGQDDPVNQWSCRIAGRA